MTVNGIVKKVRGVRASAVRLSKAGAYGHKPGEALCLSVDEAEYLLRIIDKVRRIVSPVALNRMVNEAKGEVTSGQEEE